MFFGWTLAIISVIAAAIGIDLVFT
jgi:hypothetical protein